MVARRATPPGQIDLGLDRPIDTQLAGGDAAAMNDRAARGLGILNGEDASARTQLSAIAELAATFGIERRRIEDDLGFAGR